MGPILNRLGTTSTSRSVKTAGEALSVENSPTRGALQASQPTFAHKPVRSRCVPAPGHRRHPPRTSVMSAPRARQPCPLTMSHQGHEQVAPSTSEPTRSDVMVAADIASRHSLRDHPQREGDSLPLDVDVLDQDVTASRPSTTSDAWSMRLKSAAHRSERTSEDTQTLGTQLNRTAKGRRHDVSLPRRSTRASRASRTRSRP